MQPVSYVILLKHSKLYAFQGNKFVLKYSSKLVTKLEEYNLLLKVRLIIHLGNFRVVNIWMWAVL